MSSSHKNCIAGPNQTRLKGIIILRTAFAAKLHLRCVVQCFRFGGNLFVDISVDSSKTKAKELNISKTNKQNKKTSKDQSYATTERKFRIPSAIFSASLGHGAFRKIRNHVRTPEKK